MLFNSFALGALALQLQSLLSYYSPKCGRVPEGPPITRNNCFGAPGRGSERYPSRPQPSTPRVRGHPISPCDLGGLRSAAISFLTKFLFIQFSLCLLFSQPRAGGAQAEPVTATGKQARMSVRPSICSSFRRFVSNSSVYSALRTEAGWLQAAARRGRAVAAAGGGEECACDSEVGAQLGVGGGVRLRPSRRPQSSQEEGGEAEAEGQLSSGAVRLTEGEGE